MFDLKSYENVPVIGPLLLVLTNQSVVYAVAASIAVYVVPQHQDYSLLLQGFIAVAALIAIGTRQWRDMHAFLQANRPAVQSVLSDLAHMKHTISVGGHKITFDIPDTLEPALVEALLKKLDSAFEIPPVTQPFSETINEAWVKDAGG
ncbi:MAG: hypothetical protein AMXMBFR13_48800 [Phycisphaerae bacterium]